MCEVNNGMNYELVDIKFTDLKLVYNWRNQEHIRQMMYNQDPIKWENHLKWYESLSIDSAKISKIFRINNEPIGVINVNNIDWQNQRCDWGFYIGKLDTAKGTGLLLGYVALQFILVELGFNKVVGEVLQYNEISKKFHERLGFKLDGVLRQHIDQGKAFKDVYVYSLLKEDWLLRSDQIKRELVIKFGGME